MQTLLNTTITDTSGVLALNQKALQDHINVMGKLAEDLLLYDQVLILTNSFENLSLFLLWMSSRVLEELLEQEALAFVRMSGTIGYISKSTSEVLRLSTFGLMPITGYQHGNGKPHIQTLPSEAAAARVLQESVGWEQRRATALARKIAGTTRSFDTAFLEETALPETYRDVQEDSLLRDVLDFHPADWDELSDPESRKLLRVASVNAHLQVASELGIDDLHIDALAEPLLQVKLDRVMHGKRSDEWRELCKVRHLPDVASLIVNGKLEFADVCRIRETRDCRRFREWLHSQPEESVPEEVVSAYIDALVAKKPIDKPSIKAVRVAVTTALGLLPGVGGLLAGLAGDLLDSFVLERILGGWTPNMFLDDEYAKCVSSQQ